MQYFLLFLCLISTSLFAQKVKYFNNDSVTVSQDQFEKLREKGNLSIKIGETKDSIFYRAVKRYNSVTLTTEEKNQLYNYLSSISGQQLDQQTSVVIFYHQGSDPCNLSGSADVNSRKSWYGALVNKLNSKGKVNTMVVYSLAERVKELYPDMPAYYDKYRVLNKFFKYHYPCGSFMVIQPNNNVGYYYGEYAKDTVIKIYNDTQKSKN